MACVNVCPTGIDIRDGPQLECITCALCIDACNETMEKLGRPLDLIGYTTLTRDGKESRGETVPRMWKTFIRPRTLLYFALWSGIGLAMLFTLSGRARMDLLVSQDRNPVYVMMSDGQVRNGYTVKVLNKEARPRDFIISVEGLAGARMWEALDTRAEPAATYRVRVRPDGLETLHLYVKAPPAVLEGDRADFRFVAAAVDGGERTAEDARFSGPGGK
jgi:cytochrome c oxidase accessory protein FixG